MSAEDGGAPRVEAVRVVALPPAPVLHRWNGVEVRGGGYGSDLALDPRVQGDLYLLTDRGPNFDVLQPDEKGFALPDFVPHLGHFHFDGQQIRQLGTIELRDADGAPLSGLPHPRGSSGAGETAVGLTGEALPFDPRGVDPEGLTMLLDGSFWIAEEYGPQLLHLDASGRVRERVGPSGTPRALPRVLTTRRPNRGFEGLDTLPDGRTLVAILQSALDNPSSGVRRSSVLARILTFDITTGETRQYLYPKEAPGLSCSGVCALDAATLLVIEHDARYPGDREGPSTVKRIYRVALRDATDVSDPEDQPLGLRIGGRALEELALPELDAAGIRPAAKSLVVDLLALGYPHNKPEGIGVVDDNTLVVLNDDDFGIESDGRGGIVPKVLPATGALDSNTLWFITLAAPLR